MERELVTTQEERQYLANCRDPIPTLEWYRAHSAAPFQDLLRLLRWASHGDYRILWQPPKWERNTWIQPYVKVRYAKLLDYLREQDHAEQYLRNSGHYVYIDTVWGEEMLHQYAKEHMKKVSALELIYTHDNT